MDILTNRYISPDELIQIAYKTSPRNIISFCHINRRTKDICNSNDFWNNYIADNQKTYNKLMKQLAISGELKLFRQFWGNGHLRPDNIVSDASLLFKLFENAVLNGHIVMSEYLYMLYTIKIPVGRRGKNDLYIQLKNLYDMWDIDKTQVTRNKEMIRSEFLVFLKYAIRNNSINFALKLIKTSPIDENNEGYPGIYEPLSYCKNIKILNTVLDGLQKLNIFFGPDDTIEVFALALSNSNFRLAEELLKLNSHLKSYLNFAFTAKSARTLNFIVKNFTTDEIMAYNGSIYNKDVTYYMLNQTNDEKKELYIIMNSCFAFKPHEYIDLIMNYVGCITKKDQMMLIRRALISNKWFLGKVLREEMPVCEM